MVSHIVRLASLGWGRKTLLVGIPGTLGCNPQGPADLLHPPEPGVQKQAPQRSGHPTWPYSMEAGSLCPAEQPRGAPGTGSVCSGSILQCLERDVLLEVPAVWAGTVLAAELLCGLPGPSLEARTMVRPPSPGPLLWNPGWALLLGRPLGLGSNSKPSLTRRLHEFDAPCVSCFSRSP